MTVVVETRLSFEQYMMVLLTVKRSRMRAVRNDCDGSGAKLIVGESGRQLASELPVSPPKIEDGEPGEDGEWGRDN